MRFSGSSFQPTLSLELQVQVLGGKLQEQLDRIVKRQKGGGGSWFGQLELALPHGRQVPDERQAFNL
jgi:hypothetical protein